MNTSKSNIKNVVFFDGVCNLCNGVVDFLIRKDSKNQLKYSSLQSGYAKNFFKKQEINIEDLNSVYFYDGVSIYNKSRAISAIFRKLPYPYKAIGIFIQYFPERLGNLIYDFIAIRRYTLFGKKEECRMPTSRERAKFVD
jgi:predicted DCC family thiol-disulfide oxidoreductase YuxK